MVIGPQAAYGQHTCHGHQMIYMEREYLNKRRFCFRTQTELMNLMHVNDCELKTNIPLAEPGNTMSV